MVPLDLDVLGYENRVARDLGINEGTLGDGA
jgi:hypothetical protein